MKKKDSHTDINDKSILFQLEKINKVNNINVSLQGAATLEIINGLVLDNNV